MLENTPAVYLLGCPLHKHQILLPQLVEDQNGHGLEPGLELVDPQHPKSLALVFVQYAEARLCIGDILEFVLGEEKHSQIDLITQEALPALLDGVTGGKKLPDHLVLDALGLCEVGDVSLALLVFESEHLPHSDGVLSECAGLVEADGFEIAGLYRLLWLSAQNGMAFETSESKTIGDIEKNRESRWK